MQQVTLDKLDSRHIFARIYSYAQVWKQGESWSCVDNPRKDHGFLLVLCKQVDILPKSGERLTLYAGNLIYLPKGSEYIIQFWDTLPQQKSDILINFRLYDLEGQDCRLWPKITRITEQTPPEITSLCEEISRLSQNSKNPYLQIGERFFGLMKLLRDSCLADQIEGKAQRSIYKAIAHMETHICDPLPIPELAQLCAMSETGFRALFR